MDIVVLGVVHQAFSNGPNRGREELNTHKVIGMASPMLVSVKFVVAHWEQRLEGALAKQSKNV